MKWRCPEKIMLSMRDLWEGSVQRVALSSTKASTKVRSDIPCLLSFDLIVGPCSRPQILSSIVTTGAEERENSDDYQVNKIVLGLSLSRALFGHVIDSLVSRLLLILVFDRSSGIRSIRPPVRCYGRRSNPCCFTRIASEPLDLLGSRHSNRMITFSTPAKCTRGNSSTLQPSTSLPSLLSDSVHCQRRDISSQLCPRDTYSSAPTEF